MISDHLYNFKTKRYRKSRMMEDPTKYDKPVFIHVGNHIYVLDYTEEKQDGIHAYTSKGYVKNSMILEDKGSGRLDKFDAREARRLSEKSGANELQWVLNEIKRAAESTGNNDYSFITVKRKLRDSTLVELEKRGFSVTFLDQHVEHIIMW